MKGELDRWYLFIPLRTETITNIPGNREYDRRFTLEFAPIPLANLLA